jgi:hypothetical protein
MKYAYIQPQVLSEKKDLHTACMPISVFVNSCLNDGALYSLHLAPTDGSINIWERAVDLVWRLQKHTGRRTFSSLA